MRFALIFLLSLLAFKGFSQNNEVPLNLPSEDFRFFSDAIANNIRLYKVNSQVATEKKDLERIKFLYDSLVSKVLKGTHFDNFLVTDYKSNKPIYLENFTKPIYLKTTSNWCEPNESEIQALNDIAEEFGDVIDFVVLYWDTRTTLETVKKPYTDNVHVIYVDELENYNSTIVHVVKHSLGIPSIFLMDNKRTIIDIKKGVSPSFTSQPTTEYKGFGNFNPPTSKEHFINSYTTYFEALAKDVNTILQNI